MIRLIYLTVLSLLPLFGCSVLSFDPADPASTLQNSHTTLELTLNAGYDLNPNDRGEASPLRIRLYELQAADLFNQANFLDLYQQDSASLQDSLIKTHRLPAQRPGQNIRIDIPLNTATRYIAILAEFARYQDANARAVAPVEADVRNIGTLSIEGNSLFLKVTPERTAFDRAKKLFGLGSQQTDDTVPTPGKTLTEKLTGKKPEQP